MKKYLAPVAIFSTVLFIMGMGELGGAAPADKIPVPEKNFNTLVIDREGIQTALSQFSFDGKVSLSGKRGSATVAIPFEKISQVELQVQGQEGSEVLAKVTLLDQKSIEVKVDKRSKFYGKAEFGTFQIAIKDLKSIRFQL